MKSISTIAAHMAGVAVAVVCSAPIQAAQPPARGPAQKPAVASPRTGSVRIAVRDQDGTSLSEVRLVLTGAGTGEFVTGGAGTMVVPATADAGGCCVKVRVCGLPGVLVNENVTTVIPVTVAVTVKLPAVALAVIVASARPEASV